jgi:hypothetical protein
MLDLKGHSGEKHDGLKGMQWVELSNNFQELKYFEGYPCQVGGQSSSLEQSMKTGIFQQEVQLSLTTCVTMWSIYLFTAIRIAH